MASGTLGEKGEHDWLAVTLSAGQAYEFTITGLSNFASVQVGTATALDEGVFATQTEDLPPGLATPTTQTIWFTPDSSGTYYVDISDPATIGGYGVSAVAVPNDFPNKTTTTGVVAVGGAATDGTLGQKGEHDWLAVTLSAGQAYEFTITGLSNFASAEVGTAAALDEGVSAAQTQDIPAGQATPATQTIWFTPDAGGTYYVDISDPATIGGYSVSAVTVSNDFPDNTTTTGVVAVGGAATDGTLGQKGEHDWLAVTLSAGQAYEFTITGLSNFASAQVGTATALDKGLSATQTEDLPPGLATPTTQTIWFTPDSSGTYYVDISDPATIGGYGVSAVAVPNDFPNKTTTTGVVAVGGAATDGTLGQKGEHDWLAVTLSAGQAYEFTITGLSNFASAEVGTAAALDEGVSAAQTQDIPAGQATPATQTIWFTPDAGGTYYVDISDPATIGGYSVSAVTVSNDFPDNTTTTGVVAVGGAATDGTLGQKGEHDWLAVTLSAGQAYEFTITGLSNFASAQVGTATALDKGLSATQTEDLPPGLATPTTQTIWFTPDSSGTYYVDISDPATIGGYGVSAVAVPNDFPNKTTTTGVVALVCFGKGTMIATPRGGVPVERLAVGDRVEVLLGSHSEPVVWLGYRTVGCARHPEPRKVWPVRITAGAFGPGRPARNLWLSPDHAVFVNNVLIPVKYLINGASIAQVPRDTMTYYHVELSRHSVLLAEGLPTESYLDTGDRSNFVNGNGPIAIYPDFTSRVWDAEGCAPLVVTGPELAATRRWVNGLASMRMIRDTIAA